MNHTEQPKNRTFITNEGPSPWGMTKTVHTATVAAMTDTDEINVTPVGGRVVCTSHMTTQFGAGSAMVREMISMNENPVVFAVGQA